IMAGTLVLEAIVIGLVLTVIARVDDGEHCQPWKVGFVSLLAVAMIVARGLQRRPWALPLNLALAALAVAGWVVRWALGGGGILFAVACLYVLCLRRVRAGRVAGGYLASQHD